MTAYFVETRRLCLEADDPWAVAKGAVNCVYGYLAYIKERALESEAGRIDEFYPTLDSIWSYVWAGRGTPGHLVGWDLHELCHSIGRARILIPGGWASDAPTYSGDYPGRDSHAPR
jgi:hypothetical protein